MICGGILRDSVAEGRKEGGREKTEEGEEGGMGMREEMMRKRRKKEMEGKEEEGRQGDKGETFCVHIV